MQRNMLDADEVAKHNSRDSCWVIIRDHAYDVTEYLDRHPGGAQVLLSYGGKDATAKYDSIHPQGTIESTLPPDRHLGPVKPSIVVATTHARALDSDHQGFVTPIQLCLSLDDLEAAAEKALSRQAWAYFHSAADDLRSWRNNRQDWQEISLRPRVLRNVDKADMRRKILGFQSSLPFCIAPAAFARFAHPDGELCLARGAAWANIPYCVSTGTSVSHDQLVACMKDAARGGCLFFQLYISKSKQATLDLIHAAKRLRFRALVVTVDTPVVGKREEDERFKLERDLGTGQVTKLQRTAGSWDTEKRPIPRSYNSSAFSWTDLAWVREAWGGPLIVKGIQTVEDAKLACDLGLEGIYLSNHGGRQCDDAPSAVRTLLEIRRFCPSILNKMEVWLDGGIRRGTDVLKALCLGATTVLLGRPFMYALGLYGTEGVMHAIQILSDEIETTMRLIGVTDLSQLHEELTNCERLERDLPKALSSFPLKSINKL